MNLNKYLNRTVTALMTLAVFLASCEEDEFQDGLKVADMAQAYAVNGDIHKAAFARANAGADLVSALGADELTAFLPNDNAYKHAGYFSKESVSEGDGDVLASILLYHVITGRKSSSEIASGDVPTLNTGKSFTIQAGDGIMITGLGNQGTPAKVISTDSEVTNGYIHVVDHLLLPFSRSIRDIVEQNGEFELLKAALDKAELSDGLSATGTITLFAPTDAAFIAFFNIPTRDSEGKDRPKAEVMADAYAAISAADVALLADVLQYHMLGAVKVSGDLEEGELTTLNGETISIQVDDDGNYKSVTGKGNLDEFGDPLPSKPLQNDVPGTNGIVQIVDRVLLPE
jgi:transforming growth factor-beta-induced protein